MRDSWRQFIASAGWWVWVMIGSYVLAGIGAYLDFTGEATVPIGVWITAAVFAVIVSPFMAFHKLRKHRDVLKDELESRPKIEVKPTVHNERAILEVRNIGNTRGEFTAKGRVIVGSPRLELYTMYWESVRALSCHINAGGSASILVAEISQVNRQQQRIFRGGLALFKMGTSGEQVFGVSTGKASPIKMEIDGELCDGTELTTEDSCVIEVELTSEPPMAEVFGLHSYALIVDHSRDILIFTDAPTLDRKGSQTE